MDLVRFELRDKRSPEGTLRLAIPKAYLTNRANWKGGSPQIITVRARLQDLAPLALPPAIISEDGPPERRLTGVLTIRIWSGKENTEFEQNHTRWLETKLSPGDADVKGLNHYQRVCYKEVRSPSGEVARQATFCAGWPHDHFLRNSHEGKPFLTMSCVLEEANPKGGCKASTYHVGWSVDYFFPRKYVDHWEEVDRRVRTLLDRFVPGY